MRKDEIVVGGTYSDGKKGLRKVLAEGPQYQLYPGQVETDCILYEFLGGRTPDITYGTSENGKPLMHCTRTSFASWAKERVED